MVYLFESELSENKSLILSLTNVHGLGKANADLVCKKLGFSSNLKVKNLSKEQIVKLVKTVESLQIPLSSDLKKKKLLISKELMSIKSYRGLRRNQGLPVRGQRTHTNARTARKRR